MSYICKIYPDTHSTFCIAEKVVASEKEAWEYLWDYTQYDNLPFAHFVLEEVVDGTPEPRELHPADNTCETCGEHKCACGAHNYRADY